MHAWLDLVDLHLDSGFSISKSVWLFQDVIEQLETTLAEVGF
jgi:hypothetical protein